MTIRLAGTTSASVLLVLVGFLALFFGKRLLRTATAALVFGVVANELMIRFENVPWWWYLCPIPILLAVCAYFLADIALCVVAFACGVLLAGKAIACVTAIINVVIFGSPFDLILGANSHFPAMNFGAPGPAMKTVLCIVLCLFAGLVFALHRKRLVIVLTSILGIWLVINQESVLIRRYELGFFKNAHPALGFHLANGLLFASGLFFQLRHERFKNGKRPQMAAVRA